MKNGTKGQVPIQDGTLSIRCFKSDAKRYRKAAKRLKMPLAVFIRNACDLYAKAK